MGVYCVCFRKHNWRVRASKWGCPSPWVATWCFESQVLLQAIVHLMKDISILLVPNYHVFISIASTSEDIWYIRRNMCTHFWLVFFPYLFWLNHQHAKTICPIGYIVPKGLETVKLWLWVYECENGKDVWKVDKEQNTFSNSILYTYTYIYIYIQIQR